MLCLQLFSHFSISEDVLVAAEDGPLANVTVSEAMVENGLMSEKEIVPGPAAYKVNEFIRGKKRNITLSSIFHMVIICPTLGFKPGETSGST